MIAAITITMCQTSTISMSLARIKLFSSVIMKSRKIKTASWVIKRDLQITLCLWMRLISLMKLTNGMEKVQKMVSLAKEEGFLQTRWANKTELTTIPFNKLQAFNHHLPSSNSTCKARQSIILVLKIWIWSLEVVNNKSHQVRLFLCKIKCGNKREHKVLFDQIRTRLTKVGKIWSFLVGLTKTTQS